MTASFFFLKLLGVGLISCPSVKGRREDDSGDLTRAGADDVVTLAVGGAGELFLCRADDVVLGGGGAGDLSFGRADDVVLGGGGAGDLSFGRPEEVVVTLAIAGDLSRADGDGDFLDLFRIFFPYLKIEIRNAYLKKT